MKRSNVLFLLINVILMFAAIVFLVENNKKQTAFNECIEEVSSKCKSLISYATALENENHRLNIKIRECNETR